MLWAQFYAVRGSVTWEAGAYVHLEDLVISVAATAIPSQERMVGGCLGVARAHWEGSFGEGGERAGCRSLESGWLFLWESEFGSCGLAVIHLEDVLLQMSDPVLLHGQRTMKLHLTEPDTGKKNKLNVSEQHCRTTIIGDITIIIIIIIYLWKVPSWTWTKF